ADPAAVDYIECYAYNGLIGAMKPAGDGFSYVNLLNGVKTNPLGWGTDIGGVYVTCCNLNGPEGLPYLPLIAVMSDKQGPIVNLYNQAKVDLGAKGRMAIRSSYPLDGDIRIETAPAAPQKFAVKLRIPAWSKETRLSVGNESFAATPGSYV